MNVPQKPSQATITPVPVLQLDYDTVPRPLWPRVWAGAAMLMGGLTLLVIGGCFLIGIMILLGNFGYLPVHSQLTSEQTILECVLYVLSFLSLAGGVVVIVISVRNLIRVINER